MDTTFIRGVVPPLITPVDADDRVDTQAPGRVIEHVIAGRVHGILSLGSTGEFFGLDFAQMERTVGATIEHVNGRVPVYVGIGAISTRQCIQLATLAEKENARAITVLPPMFLTPNEDELFAHFTAIAESTALPMLIYNNPDRMPVNISANLVERLSGVRNIAGIKDSSGDLTLTSEFIRRTREKGFKVMAGRDLMILGTLAHGGVGCVAATANIVPALVVEIYDKFMAGDWNGAREAQFKLSPLRLAFGLASFPAAVKDAMNLLGFEVGQPIRPNTGCSPANLSKLRGILKDMGAIKGA